MKTPNPFKNERVQDGRKLNRSESLQHEQPEVRQLSTPITIRVQLSPTTDDGSDSSSLLSS
jgi:hypothetical protein